jgi:C4-type Zn-finger protein
MKVIIKNFECPECKDNEFSLDKNRRKNDEFGTFWISRKTCLNCAWKEEYNLMNSVERAEKLRSVGK